MTGLITILVLLCALGIWEWEKFKQEKARFDSRLKSALQMPEDYQLRWSGEPVSKDQLEEWRVGRWD